MTEDQKTSCNPIIHGAAVGAAAVGALPIPGADILPICAIQGAMIISLARVFKYPITESIAKEMAKTYMMGQAGKFLAGQLIKLIPFAGSAGNAAVAAGLTETLGWETAEKFANETA